MSIGIRMLTGRTTDTATIAILGDARATQLVLAHNLEGLGYHVRCEDIGSWVDVAAKSEVAIVVAPRNCGWTAGIVAALRASDVACASILMLESSSPNDIRQGLQAGAIDCLMSPVEAGILRESVVAAIACTRRWRERFRAAGAPAVEIASPIARTATAPEPGLAQIFEPIDDAPDPGASTEERIDRIVRQVGVQNQLTPREHEVLYWLLQGHRYDDIATLLGVASRTAKFHAANLLRKLDLDSRHELPRLLAREI